LLDIPLILPFLQPDYIAPVVGYLTSEANTETTGQLFEISGGWAAQTRWQRAGGYGFPTNRVLTPEDVISKWDVFTNFGTSHEIKPGTRG
jgi:multifunctional beta-oxidation protein